MTKIVIKASENELKNMFVITECTEHLQNNSASSKTYIFQKALKLRDVREIVQITSSQ